MLKVRVVLLLPVGETIEVRAGFPPEDMLDDADLAAAKWTWQHAQPAGRGADTLPGAKRLVPSDEDRPRHGRRHRAGQRHGRSDCCRPTSGGCLTPCPTRRRSRSNASIWSETSTARDSPPKRSGLRNALADIDFTRSAHAAWPRFWARRRAFAPIANRLTTRRRTNSLRTIQEEAERLNRFIANLLDMTRLESGAVQSRNETVDVGDVVGSALQRATAVLAQHKVQLELDAGLPMAQGDPVLLEQVLFNLLDNAAKYTPPGTAITLGARRDDGRIALQVADEGPGLPDDARERVFDKFYRVHAADRQRAGTGLGLAICRGFVEAMGGTITAANRARRRGCRLHDCSCRLRLLKEVSA